MEQGSLLSVRSGSPHPSLDWNPPCDKWALLGFFFFFLNLAVKLPPGTLREGGLLLVLSQKVALFVCRVWSADFPFP